MNKIKRYIECYVPTETCNFRCHYCYITQQGRFANKLASFPHPPGFIRKALSVQRLGGTCLLNVCAGGETLLSAELLPVIQSLLEEGHYVMIVTNGILSKRFDEILQFPEDLRKRLMIKFSFHYLELIRLNLVDAFFDNIAKMKKAGVSFTVEITPNDESIAEIEKIQDMCLARMGTSCHVTIARDDNDPAITHLSKLSFVEFCRTWSVFDSDLLDFKKNIFYQKRNEYCYAGEWSVYLNLCTGDMWQCYAASFLQNIYADIGKPIKFLPVGKKCSLPHCYNGHAFLALGAIPTLKTPTYASLRNRETHAGPWLNGTAQEFLSSKLYESNPVHSPVKKISVAFQNHLLRIRNKLRRR